MSTSSTTTSYKFLYAFFVAPDPTDEQIRLQFTTDEQEECFLSNHFEGMSVGQAAHEARIWAVTGNVILDRYLLMDEDGTLYYLY
ncbi:hypothetical protein INT45_004031 [Circinella minor]|uniref:Uncharacterized protein n=1 Tax=Circinella minor TaxID=1195481 RepID=A0A8H7RIC8_9FUNG|nr:hypothetical protein INT45_004031 [Circinella minor]